MKDIFEEMVRLQREGKKAALASLVWSLGSVPMPRAAKMLVHEDGTLAGTVGGGCLEAEAWQAAMDVMKGEHPRLLSFNLTEEQAAETGFICGGKARILVEPILPGRWQNVFSAVQGLLARRGKGALVLLTEADGQQITRMERALLQEDGVVTGQAEEAALAEAREMLEASPHEAASPKNVRLGAADVFLERIAPQQAALVFGAGHVGIATAQIAKIAGFVVVAVDDRETFANRPRLPFADQVIVADFENAFRDIRVDEDCYIVIVTRGHLYDRQVAQQALTTPARYIGMIGSRRKIRVTLSHLEEAGFSKEDVGRIHAPIGLDIGAETAQEIAVAVVAQMIEVMRRGASGARRG